MSKQSRYMGVFLGAGWGTAVLCACAVDTFPPPNTAEASSLVSGQAIDVAESWVAGWFAPNRGQRGPNVYRHEGDGVPLGVFWASDPNPAHPRQFSSTSDCSYFISATMKKAYGWTDATLKAWLCPATFPCTTRPLAKHYYNAIFHSSRFSIIRQAPQLSRGDLIAIRYGSGRDSGHVVWVDSQASLSGTGTDANGATIYYYNVDVIDSSSTYHGTADLRAIHGIRHGIGRGTMRLVTYVDGDLAGYTWSTWSGSALYVNGDGQGHWIVGGRYAHRAAPPARRVSSRS
jgi:hypothetical protein